jgi:hypothetical protein
LKTICVKYPLLCIITAAFSLVSWNLIVQGIEAIDSKVYDNPFSEKHLGVTPKTDIVPSKPILGSQNIKHRLFHSSWGSLLQI